MIPDTNKQQQQHPETDPERNAQMDDDLAIPSEYVCPLTLEVMVDPVVSKYGKSFERSAILSWLANGHGTCPLTRQPMKLSDLVTDHRLRVRIHAWRRANDVEIPLFTKAPNHCMMDGGIFGIITIDTRPDEDRAERSEDDPDIILELRDPQVSRRHQHRRRSTRESSQSRTTRTGPPSAEHSTTATTSSRSRFFRNLFGYNSTTAISS